MTTARLIDGFVTEPDVRSRHSLRIAATPERAWKALWTVDLGEVFVVRLLLGLRGLPKLLTGQWPKQRTPRPTLIEMQEAGFGKLGEVPDRQVLFGVEGRFWSPAANIDPFDAGSFDEPVAAGRARAVWDFEVRPDEGGTTVLATETRVVCGDRASRRKFRAYWLVVRPFSGLIRTVMLRAIRDAAESD